MVFLIEDKEYSCESLEKYISPDSVLWPDDKKRSNTVKINYVGYYRHLVDGKDVSVYILPKNFAEVDPFKGKIDPSKGTTEPVVIDSNTKVDEDKLKKLKELPLWMLGSLCRYRKRIATKIIDPVEDVVLHQGVDDENFLAEIDSIMSLKAYYHKHEHLVFSVYHECHHGMNKINWRKTISSTLPFVNSNGDAVYVNPINRRKMIHSDEDLMVLFFSTLQYITRKYGIETPTSPFYNTIDEIEFDRMVEDDMILSLLDDIRDNYYRDEMVELWQLLRAYYEKKGALEKDEEKKEEYLLAKDYDRVFEDMMDYLLTDDDLKWMKKQRDNKRIDHIFRGRSLFWDKDVFYVADSKYYAESLHESRDKVSMYKQFTYVLNGLQVLMDVKNGEIKGTEAESVKELADNYLDPLTGGFDVTPNFFVRGKINADYDYNKLDFAKVEDVKVSKQTFFPDRLFDRNTLYTLSYELNLLALLKLYATQNDADQQSEKQNIADDVRQQLHEKLRGDFNFYELTQTGDEKAALRNCFYDVQGKVIKRGDKLILAIKKYDKGLNSEVKQYFTMNELKK